MNVRGLLAAWRAVVLFVGFALATSSTGCMVAPEGAEQIEEETHDEAERAEVPASEVEVEVEEPLDLTVDALDVVHGSLRIIATMTDGAADVSVRLGGDCEHREIGGGISTPSTLVWAFGEDDLAGALKCGLVVRARAQDGNGFVSKIATLDVTTATTPDSPAAPIAEEAPTAEETPTAESVQAAPAAEDVPALQAASAGEDGIHLVFAPLSPSARLTTGDSVLDATRSDPNDDAPAADGAGEFTVPLIDFARSVLRNRALTVDGTRFVTSLSIGGLSLDGSVATEGAEATDGAETTESAEPVGEVEPPALTDETVAPD